MNSFRAELEIAYQKNDMDTFGVDGLEVDASVIDEFDGNFSSFTGLVNGYYDFDTGTDFMPYLTAGIGLSTVDIEISLDDDELFDEPINESDDDSVIAYHLGAGIGYLISENIIIDLRYRYFMTSDPKFDTVSAEYGSHNITGGIRINF
jgi:opacity protein-like surface antigen